MTTITPEDKDRIRQLFDRYIKPDLWREEVALFTLGANQELAPEVASFLGIPLGQVTAKRFADGEPEVQIQDNVRGKHVVVINSTGPSLEPFPGESGMTHRDSCANLMFLAAFNDAANRASASQVTNVIPYYGFGRSDRKDKPRVPINARIAADILELANRVVDLDLHSGQIQGMFSQGFPVDNLYGLLTLTKHLIERVKKNGVDRKNVVIAGADLGAKVVKKLAKEFGLDLVQIDKDRLSDCETHTDCIIGDVKGKVVLLLDDMLTTGSTLYPGGRAVRQAGATDVLAAFVHPVIVPKGLERLQQNDVFSYMCCLNTLDWKYPAVPIAEYLKVLSAAPLIGQTLLEIFTHGSVSKIFGNITA
ncbi:MAG: ribose-phosphate diphosphokinase [Patescibacteria group bacterium]